MVFLQSIGQKLIDVDLWLDFLEYVDIESMKRSGPWGVCHLAGDGASGVGRQVWSQPRIQELSVQAGTRTQRLDSK